MQLMKPLVLSVALALPTVALAHGGGRGHAAHHSQAQRVKVSVTSQGFTTSQTKVKAGQPVTLVVTRRVERTCATDIVIKDFGINLALPLNVPVEVTFTPTKPGKVHFACAMDMVAGDLVVE